MKAFLIAIAALVLLAGTVPPTPADACSGCRKAARAAGIERGPQFRIFVRHCRRAVRQHGNA